MPAQPTIIDAPLSDNPSIQELGEKGKLEEGAIYFEHQNADTGKLELTKMKSVSPGGVESPLYFEDGMLFGVIQGGLPSPYTGRVEDYKMYINGLPVEGIGGGSGGGSNVEIVKISIAEPKDPSYPIPVFGVDKTFAELEAAVLAGKTIIANCSKPETGKIGSRISDMLFILQTLYDDTNLLYLNGELSSFESGYTDSVLLNHYALKWNSSDALPTISLESIELQIHGGN